MGFFSNLRAASTVSYAARFIEKHLRAQAEIGRFNGDALKLGEGLVMGLWESVPELANQSDKPKPVCVAAAALSMGIQQADQVGKKELGNVLFSALQTLIMYDVVKLAPIEKANGADLRLLDMAYAVIDKK